MHAGGQEFESLILHLKEEREEKRKKREREEKGVGCCSVGRFKVFFCLQTYVQGERFVGLRNASVRFRNVLRKKRRSTSGRERKNSDAFYAECFKEFIDRLEE